MSLRPDLVALQEFDTSIDHARLRLERLAERAAVTAARDSLQSIRERRSTAEAERDAAERELEAVEKESHDIDSQRVRLEGQMKTIISPREAEALQHEIAMLVERRSDLDDRGLQLLDAIADAEQRASDAAAAEPDAVDALASAEAVLAAAASELTDQIDRITAERERASALVPTSARERYEAMRRQHAGVAVARLVGAQCTGCHIDLSVGESDDVRRVPDDQLPECPNCGRLLVP